MTARLDVEINASGAKSGAREADRALNSVKKSARGADSAVSQFQKSLLITSATAVFVAGMGKATQASIQFADALAEVSTLLGDVPGEMDQISDAAKEQAIQFGSMPVEQTKAFYQIISAGASDAAEATETLTAANKLAIGGVTSVQVAADGLTSSWNVYQNQVGNVTELSDALFVGMKQGKTTIGELSSSIGKVAPLAEKAGVSFDELIASIAALTKGGISTNESITGVRAVLAAVVKPSQEALKEAKKLNFEFSAGALKTKKLAGFLAELEEKTKGNTDTLAKFFGGVEALVPVLALSGSGAKSFTDILDAMLNKAGATEDAFNKMADSPGFQIKRLMAAIAVAAIEAGDALSSILAPAAELVVENLDEIVIAAEAVGAMLIVAFGPQIIAMLEVQLVGAIGLVTKAIWGLNAAVTANPLGVLAVALAAGLVLLNEYDDQVREFIFGKRETISALEKETEEQKKNAAEIKKQIDLQQKLNQAIKDRNKTVSDTFANLVSETNLLYLSRTATKAQIDQKKIALSLQNQGILLTPKETSLLQTLIAEKGNIVKIINDENKANQKRLKITSDLEAHGQKKLKSVADITDSLKDEITILKALNTENDTTIEWMKIEQSLRRQNIVLEDFEIKAIKKLIAAKKALSLEGAAPPTPTEGAKAFTFGEGFEDRLDEMVDSSEKAAAKSGAMWANVFGPGGTLQVGLADSIANAWVFEKDFKTSMARIGDQIKAKLISNLIQTGIEMASTSAKALFMADTTSGAIIAGNDAVTGNAIMNQKAVAVNAVGTNATIASSAAPAAALEAAATGGFSATAGQIAFTAALVAMLALAARANGMIEFAKGGAFTNNVVSSPTVFPLGQMGEAGPEAIMPLSRDSSGRLGVMTVAPTGGGGTVFAPVIKVDIGNVSGDGEAVGSEVASQVKAQMDAAFSDYLRKQQRPGGQLNRQRSF